VLHRHSAERVGGLSGAVAAGIEASSSPFVVVMDGDLQHPPQLAPVLVATGEREGADVVIGSRYTGGGDNAGLDGASRRIVSSSATWCARALFPGRLRRVTDPMSGFFAVRRDRLHLTDLRPHGFKILLEVVVRHPGLRMTEVGFVFGERFAGESKASLREGMRYVRHLTRLRVTGYAASVRRRRATVTRAALFGGAGVTGIGVNALALWALVAGVHAPYLVGAALATQVSTTWNWALTEKVVFPGPKPRTTLRRYLSFSAVNNAALLLRLPVLALLVSALGMHYLVANLLTLAAAFLVRFAASDRLIYRLDGGVA
jgi:putative flippase GtrA